MTFTKVSLNSVHNNITFTKELECGHTIAFVRLGNYDAIVFAKRKMRFLQLFAHISMMVLPLLEESGYITVV